MNIFRYNISILFYIFLIIHLIIWTIVPSFVNQNLPLDTIETLAWGSNLNWGFDKHPPASAFFSEIIFQIFGSQDWAYYLLSQIFVITAFYYVFKFAKDFLNNDKLSLISVILLEAIYFYNYTTPEFNVNVCQLPFWSLVVYFSWKIYKDNEIKISDCLFIGLFSAIGFLSKYIFIYLLISISLLFAYLFLKKNKKFNFKYLLILEVFLILIIPHFIWLFNNDFVTIFYGLKRTGLEYSVLFDHLKFPTTFILKQIGILIPFLILISFLVKNFEFKKSLHNKKTLFITVINFLPIILILVTSIVLGSKIRTMWMTPFYLYLGVFFIYIFKNQIKLKEIKKFYTCIILLFFLSPAIYSTVSITQSDKRTDYPGKEISDKIQYIWNLENNSPINVVLGNEWKGGNLSYHLKSRPVWEGEVDNKKLSEYNLFICIDDICVANK